MKNYYIIIYFLILAIPFVNTIYPKTSSEIDREIKYKNNELEELRTQINELEQKILNKTNEAILS